MGGFFDFSFLDVWNNPIMRILRWGVKTTAKGIATANEKEQIQTATTPEFMDLIGEAENGNSDAQYELGQYYVDDGKMEKATYWFTKSAEQGNEYALEMLDILQNP